MLSTPVKGINWCCRGGGLEKERAEREEREWRGLNARGAAGNDVLGSAQEQLTAEQQNSSLLLLLLQRQ